MSSFKVLTLSQTHCWNAEKTKTRTVKYSSTAMRDSLRQSTLNLAQMARRPKLYLAHTGLRSSLTLNNRHTPSPLSPLTPHVRNMLAHACVYRDGTVTVHSDERSDQSSRWHTEQHMVTATHITRQPLMQSKKN